MGFRDLHASLAQFNLEPVDPEQEYQARLERLIAESMHLAGVDEEAMSFTINDPSEQWTVVYDKFRQHRR